MFLLGLVWALLHREAFTRWKQVLKASFQQSSEGAPSPLEPLEHWRARYTMLAPSPAAAALWYITHFFLLRLFFFFSREWLRNIRIEVWVLKASWREKKKKKRLAVVPLGPPLSARPEARCAWWGSRLTLPSRTEGGARGGSRWAEVWPLRCGGWLPPPKARLC